MHHVVTDAWSRTILVRELTALYAARVEGRTAVLPALSVQYADYAIWHRTWLQGPALEAQLQYWRDELANAPVLELATDRPRPATPSQNGAVIPVSPRRDPPELRYPGPPAVALPRGLGRPPGPVNEETQPPHYRLPQGPSNA